jgi:hypothetical protein
LEECPLNSYPSTRLKPDAYTVTNYAALAPLALDAYATQDIALDTVFGQLPLPLPFCSIRIQYSGPPGTVIGEVSSIEQRGDLVIDSRVTNEADWLGMSGAHPWHLDEETESVLFLTNAGDQECPIGFMVQAGGVHYYLTDLRLKPHETRAIDLRKLRDAQLTDFKGNKIPAAATAGSVLWGRADNVPVMGRLVVMQRHKGMASNYTCGTGCACPASPSVEGEEESLPQAAVRGSGAAYAIDRAASLPSAPTACV